MLKLSMIKWPLITTPLVSHYISKLMSAIISKLNWVDNAQSESEISDLFADKYQNLYNYIV